MFITLFSPLIFVPLLLNFLLTASEVPTKREVEIMKKCLNANLDGLFDIIVMKESPYDMRRVKRNASSSSESLSAEEKEQNKGKKKITSISKPHFSEDEIIRVHAKIVFYSNGTRMVDIENGPLVLVLPNGEMFVDFRNGTVKTTKIGSDGKWGESAKMEKNDKDRRRKRRFASMNELYMANGLEFQERNADSFGELDEAEQQKVVKHAASLRSGTKKNSFNRDTPKREIPRKEREEEQKEGELLKKDPKSFGSERELAIAEANKQKNADNKNSYWLRPLYERENGRLPHVPVPEEFKKQSSPNKFLTSTPHSWAEPLLQQSPLSKHREDIHQIHPPSPSPNSWLRERLHSGQPLSADEEVLMRVMLQQLGDARNTKTAPSSPAPLIASTF